MVIIGTSKPSSGWQQIPWTHPGGPRPFHRFGLAIGLTLGNRPADGKYKQDTTNLTQRYDDMPFWSISMNSWFEPNSLALPAGHRVPFQRICKSNPWSPQTCWISLPPIACIRNININPSWYHFEDTVQKNRVYGYTPKSRWISPFKSYRFVRRTRFTPWVATQRASPNHPRHQWSSASGPASGPQDLRNFFEAVEERKFKQIWAAIGQEFSASLEKMAKATPLGALMSR